MIRIDISVFVKDIIENIPTPYKDKDIRKQVDKYIYRFDKFLNKKALSVYELTYDMADDKIYVTTEIRDYIKVPYQCAKNAEDIMECVSIYVKHINNYLTTAKLKVDGVKWERR